MIFETVIPFPSAQTQMKETQFYLILILCILCSVLLMSSCGTGEVQRGYPENVESYLTEIDATDQRQGDPVVGKEYLLNGDFIKSGIPIDIYENYLSNSSDNNALMRTGINADIAFDYTSVVAESGAQVVAPNCFQCHAGYADGEFILGLGNTGFDFTIDQTTTLDLLDNLIETSYGNPSPEWDAYYPFTRAVRATGSHLPTETIGSNPADKLALVLGAHRNKDDLSWIENPQYAIPAEVIPADVPAWWLLKKKSVMFSTGIGRGDYAKMMMASSVLTLRDSSDAREIDEQFVNVAAFINSLEAPKYPGPIDDGRAAQGKILFEDNCSVCHGSYGSNAAYKTLLVDHGLINTDPHLASSNYAYADFKDWFNNSWFATDTYGARIEPGDGYIAPPLDGVWATAPYFHNGSVPTISDVLDSETRPELWSRSFNTTEYDHDKLGWLYTVETEKKNNRTYNTNLLGYGNQGHTFGDHLSVDERNDLLEYLKSL